MTRRDVFGRRFLEPEDAMFTRATAESDAQAPPPERRTSDAPELGGGLGTVATWIVCAAFALCATSTATEFPNAAPPAGAVSGADTVTVAATASVDRADVPLGWQAYLASLGERGLSPSHAREVSRLWKQTCAVVGGLAEPQAAPTPEGALLLSWDNGDHHVDVEVFDGGRLEWFYSHRSTGEHDGEEGALEDGVPLRFVPFLRRLT